MTIPERNSEAEPRLNPQMAIELILGRQLISYLGVPMFLVDPRGDLLYYNEAAEAVLGIRFEETGRMLREEWSHVFSPTDADGNPIEPEDLPLVIALERGRPAEGAALLCGNSARQTELVWAARRHLAARLAGRAPPRALSGLPHSR